MRSLFPGYFRPTAKEFSSLWTSCRFSVDANVLLNLYRYSQATRAELEKALGGVKERLFLPNQAAKEFLRNRVGVTLGQLIHFAKETPSDLIFITGDKKDDWWLEQSGRTIGPRPELVEEFARETGKVFWMYSVDKFVEEAAKTSNTTVSEAILAEIIETREETRSEVESSPASVLGTDGKKVHPVLSEEEVLKELRTFLASHDSEDGSVGLRYFVVSYLGRRDFEINHSYAHLNKGQ